jgi:hypothetical protein
MGYADRDGQMLLPTFRAARADTRNTAPREALLKSLRSVALALLLALLGASEGLAKADVAAAEYQVKAAFLYKFMNYVEWPARAQAGAETQIVIGVVGADMLADELAQVVAGRGVNGRPVVVRKLKAGDPVTGLHTLFIGGAADAHTAELIAAANSNGVLTVTESEDAFGLGSVINFVVVQDKVRFDIALQQAESNNLKISSRLLAVARKVV